MRRLATTLALVLVALAAACGAFSAADNPATVDGGADAAGDDPGATSSDAGLDGDRALALDASASDPFFCLRGTDAAVLTDAMPLKHSCGRGHRDGGCYKEVDWCTPDGAIQACAFPAETLANCGKDDDCNGLVDDGVNCMQSLGASAGYKCVGCGLEIEYTYTTGGGVKQESYTTYRNTADCLTTELCGTTASFVGVKEQSENSITCATFCTTIGRTCAETCWDDYTNRGCFADAGAPNGVGVGYRQIETSGCIGQGTCSTVIVHPSNGWNAVCCCQ